jgi:GntR family transcriptional regulator
MAPGHARVRSQDAGIPPPEVDLTSDRSVYKQIADWLRERIDDGWLQTDDKLPSESELMRQFGTTRTTVRRALESLAAEGRVRAERGVGVFVRETVRPDAIVRTPYDRLARHHRDAGRSGLQVDAQSRGLEVRQDIIQLEEVPAPAAIAEQLGIDEGDTVFVRRRRMWMGDMPTQLADSYLPLDIAVGVLREESTGAGGTHARIEENGHHLTHFVERLNVRMPVPAEMQLLRLEAGVPVVDLIQTAYAGDRAVECFVAVIAGDKYRFKYRIEAA